MSNGDTFNDIFNIDEFISDSIDEIEEKSLEKESKETKNPPKSSQKKTTKSTTKRTKKRSNSKKSDSQAYTPGTPVATNKTLAPIDKNHRHTSIPSLVSKYPTPEEFQKRIDSYFQSVKASKTKTITHTGFLRHIKASQYMLNTILETTRPEFFEYRDIAMDAKARIVEHYETMLQRPGANSGIIFAMRNFGWSGDDNPGGNKSKPDKIVNITVNNDNTRKALKEAVGSIQDANY